MHRAQSSRKSAGQPRIVAALGRTYRSRLDRARRFAPIGAIALALVAFFAIASSADAAHFQRPFKEVFGSADQPSFSRPIAVAVDRKTGDVLVLDSSTQSIERFEADGAPAPFAALGTNVIDGREANGKPCSEEPASCDKTPQDGLETPFRPEEIEIAVDESGGPTDGNIYISQPGAKALDIFAADGTYLGQLTEAESILYSEGPFGVAVDPAGNVYLTSVRINATGAYINMVNKYAPRSNPPVNADFVASYLMPQSALYNIALGSGPTENMLFAMSTDGKGGTQAYEFDLPTGEVKYKFGFDVVGEGAIAVDPHSGTVLMGARRPKGAEVTEFEAPSGSEPTQISRIVAPAEVAAFAVTGSSEVILADGSPQLQIYRTPGIVPTVAMEPATEVLGTKATLAGTVNPTGLPVTSCFFEYGETTAYGQTAPCEGPIGDDSNTYPVRAGLTGLNPNGQVYHFRLVATNANGTEESADQTLTTADTTVTEAATAIDLTSATLNGTVLPEGDQYTGCFFEYGLSSSPTFEKTVLCSPGAASIAADYLSHPVKAPITGLKVGATYRFRLVAANGFGTVKGSALTVTTHGAPRLSDIGARNADQDSVTLEGKVNPSGFGTSYHFEWGPTSSYGHVLPAEFEPFVGSGEAPVRVAVKVAGLAAGTTYHYRLVAGSERGGVSASSDQIFETLNTCNLPEGRCDELVSRRDAGPIAIPGEFFSPAEMHYQAATSGPGLAYPVEAGYPEATKGAQVLYRASRGPSEWGSTQLSAPISGQNEQQGVQSGNGPVEWLSNDLSCGFQNSYQLLTADPGTRLVREYGGSNLYRLNPDGSHTAVTALAPENPEASSIANYEVAGASQNCRKVVFVSTFRYPGVPALPGNGFLYLYEWEEGTLRSVGFVPGEGGGEVPVGAVPGTGTSTTANSQNVVSEDGSRVFFAAQRQTSSNPAEVGRLGVFVRENGKKTRDLSESQTSVPDTEATYQWATPDGSCVFFTANAGLTTESSPGGTDLYKYNLETDELTDVSAWTDPENPNAGAEVGGFVAASPNGAKVYFAARGQLVAGKGNTTAQNNAEETYSIFGASEGSGGHNSYTYAGEVSATNLNRVILDHQGSWVSQTTPDGRYLLFESTENVTPYNSGGASEAYLYDSQQGSEGTICVSCRPDGQPSVAPSGAGGLYTVLPTDEAINNWLHQPRFLVERDGRPIVFFSSPDVLAPGAIEHQNNVYEWSHGQVFRLTSAQKGQQSPYPIGGYYAGLGGASNDGSDVYFVTPETLTWEDGDARISAYDARIGGGYPRPPLPPAACEPTEEGSCHRPSQGAVSIPGPVTPNITGSENVEPSKHKGKKKLKRKRSGHAHHRAKRHKAKRARRSARNANGNRRAGK